MQYVQPLGKGQAPKEAEPVLTAIDEKFGTIPNIFKTLAYQPDVLQGVTSINDGIQHDLPGKLRELAYLKSSLTNDCEYCSHYHRKAAEKEGASDDQLEAIENYASSDAFDEEEKAVLAYAEELTRDGNVGTKTVDQVKAHLNDTQLVTLAATVALANFTNRINHGLAVELP
jgi:uncharacterized peroxidase-related enzyme